MAIYQKRTSTGGAWVDKSVLTGGQKCKIVSETNPLEGQHGTQDVCKVRFEGIDEPVNTPLNQTTINGLVEAFGTDSKNWQGNELTVQIEASVIGGKRVKILYLVPAGYELGENEGGYVVIIHKKPQDESRGTTGQAEPENTVTGQTEANTDESDSGMPF